MTLRLGTCIAAILLGMSAGAQNDSVRYNPDVTMPDGIYLSYNDLRYNTPVTKEQVVSDLDKEQLEFITKTMFADKFSFRRNDSVITKDTRSTWGFVQNNTFYVFLRDDYYRIPVFGSISYLVANVTVISPGFYDPRFGYYTTGRTREIREFLINFYDGKVVEFTMNQLEELISRDAELYQDFRKLGRRKQKEQLYRFIRRYNERHPVFFLKK